MLWIQQIFTWLEKWFNFCACIVLLEENPLFILRNEIFFSYLLVTAALSYRSIYHPWIAALFPCHSCCPLMVLRALGFNFQLNSGDSLCELDHLDSQLCVDGTSWMAGVVWGDGLEMFKPHPSLQQSSVGWGSHHCVWGFLCVAESWKNRGVGKKKVLESLFIKEDKKKFENAK